MLAVGGPVAVAGAWMLVRSGRVSLWVANGVLMPIVGGLSLMTGLVQTSERFGFGWAGFLGVIAGAGLYAATAGFMALAGRWPPLARHTSALYENRSEVTLPVAVLVSTILVAPGEELLWRGVVQQVVRDALGSPGWLAPVVAWLAYVAANAVSASVPIILGALVGGAAWTGLAVTTDGVLASIACHVVWTGLMVAFPPVPRPR